MSDNFHKGSVKEERPIYDFDNSPEDNDSESQSSRNDDKELDGKGKKKYSVIPQNIREKFIKRVLSKEVTIKDAAKEFGLKFSTSKAILQTYKKEGRIGKKKNRERKTKVVNVVFVCNINPKTPYASSIFPIISMNEIKGSKSNSGVEENKNKLVEQTLLNYPEHKIVHQTNLQIPNDSNKSTQQFIKELGNEFLKDFIEKNFANGKGPSLSPMSGSMNGMPNNNPMNNQSVQNNSMGLGNTASMSSVINLNSMPPPHLNGMSNMGGAPFMMSQQYGMNSELPQMMGQSYMNQQNSNQMNSMMSMNQKRSFQSYEKDTIPELELKNEQITEMSVKKFKSGEDVLWDYDMDRSKRDLEDFIYKTHNAIKNNTYIGSKTGFGQFCNLPLETVTFDFSKYKDDFND